jgi:hypothetical protein
MIIILRLNLIENFNAENAKKIRRKLEMKKNAALESFQLDFNLNVNS